MLDHLQWDRYTRDTAASCSVLRTRWSGVLPQPTTTPSVEAPGFKRCSTSVLVGKQIGLISSVISTGFAKRNRAIFADSVSGLKCLWTTISETSCNTGFLSDDQRLETPSSTLTYWAERATYFGVSVSGPRYKQRAAVISHSLSMRVAIQPSISPKTLK